MGSGSDLVFPESAPHESTRSLPLPVLTRLSSPSPSLPRVALVVKKNESLNPLDVSLLRAYTHVPKPHHGADLIKQFGCRLKVGVHSHSNGLSQSLNFE